MFLKFNFQVSTPLRDYPAVFSSSMRNVSWCPFSILHIPTYTIRAPIVEGLFHFTTTQATFLLDFIHFNLISIIVLHHYYVYIGVLFCKCINGSLPGYLNEHLVINNTQHNRSMRYASYNSICRYYKRETEGGCSFVVSAAKLWNNVPLFTRKLDSIKSLKTNLFNTMFAAQ